MKLVYAEKATGKSSSMYKLTKNNIHTGHVTGSCTGQLKPFVISEKDKVEIRSLNRLRLK